jgi:hypothetical protein
MSRSIDHSSKEDINHLWTLLDMKLFMTTELINPMCLYVVRHVPSLSTIHCNPLQICYRLARASLPRVALGILSTEVVQNRSTLFPSSRKYSIFCLQKEATILITGTTGRQGCFKIAPWHYRKRNVCAPGAANKYKGGHERFTAPQA